jgi:hypothetical protein
MKLASIANKTALNAGPREYELAARHKSVRETNIACDRDAFGIDRLKVGRGEIEYREFRSIVFWELERGESSRPFIDSHWPLL